MFSRCAPRRYGGAPFQRTGQPAPRCAGQANEKFRVCRRAGRDFLLPACRTPATLHLRHAHGVCTDHVASGTPQDTVGRDDEARWQSAHQRLGRLHASQSGRSHCLHCDPRALGAEVRQSELPTVVWTSDRMVIHLSLAHTALHSATLVKPPGLLARGRVGRRCPPIWEVAVRAGLGKSWRAEFEYSA